MNQAQQVPVLKIKWHFSLSLQFTEIFTKNFETGHEPLFRKKISDENSKPASKALTVLFFQSKQKEKQAVLQKHDHVNQKDGLFKLPLFHKQNKNSKSVYIKQATKINI
jgi:hypothetical protein